MEWYITKTPAVSLSPTTAVAKMRPTPRIKHISPLPLPLPDASDQLQLRVTRNE